MYFGRLWSTKIFRKEAILIKENFEEKVLNLLASKPEEDGFGVEPILSVIRYKEDGELEYDSFTIDTDEDNPANMSDIAYSLKIESKNSVGACMVLMAANTPEDMEKGRVGMVFYLTCMEGSWAWHVEDLDGCQEIESLDEYLKPDLCEKLDQFKIFELEIH